MFIIQFYFNYLLYKSKLESERQKQKEDVSLKEKQIKKQSVNKVK